MVNPDSDDIGTDEEGSGEADGRRANGRRATADPQAVTETPPVWAGRAWIVDRRTPTRKASDLGNES